MSDETNGKEDNDELFLDQVLNTLYDFGDKQAKKKSQKKKKRKRCEEEEEEHVAAEGICDDTKDSTTEFHLDNTNTHHANREQTGPCLQRAQVEVVTFQDPRRPKALRTAAPEPQKASQMTEEKKKEDSERLSLEKARLEVHRFGITGYKKEQQRVFEQERAVMLGAKPPRKEYVNYKLLQVQLKDKKQKNKEVAQELKKKTKKPIKNRDEKKKWSSGSGSAPSGQVGRFKNGLLMLTSKEIRTIKGGR